MNKLPTDPRLPIIDDPKLRPLVQRFYELFRQICNFSNASAMWDGQGTSAPTTGTWSVGDKVENTGPSEAGSAGSQYVIIGWVCTAEGAPGTWREMRVFTGN